MIRCHFDEFNRSTFDLEMGVVVPNVGDEIAICTDTVNLFRVKARRFTFLVESHEKPPIVHMLHVVVERIQ